MHTTHTTGLNRTQRALAYAGAALFFLAALTLSVSAAWSKGGTLILCLAFAATAVGAEVFKATLAPIIIGRRYGVVIRSLAALLFLVCLASASLNALQFANSQMTNRQLEIANEQRGVNEYRSDKARHEAKATAGKTQRERIAAEASLKELSSKGEPTQYVSYDPAAKWLYDVFGLEMNRVEQALVGLSVLLLELGSALGFTLAHSGGQVVEAAVAERALPSVTINPVLGYLAAQAGETFSQRKAAEDLGLPLTELHRELHRLKEAGEIVLHTTKSGTNVSLS
jgi:hypothetical protein